MPTTPAAPTGELVRAMRLYIGLSQREMARHLSMDRRTFQRIESGTEDCSRTFAATMLALVDTFDTEVEQTINAAEKMLGPATGAVHFPISTNDDPACVWTRAVIGRAAVESGLIVPKIPDREAVA